METKYSLLLVLGTIISLYILSVSFCNAQIPGENPGLATEVRIVDGVPRIFVNGSEYKTVAAQLYNYPNLTPYGPAWVAGIKKTIDAEKKAGATLMLIHLWWSDLDKSIARPKQLGDNLDFTYVDQVMDYAKQKQMKIMLLTGMHTMTPEWWNKEQGFPQPAQTSATFCMPKVKGAIQSCIPKELCAAGDPYCCSKNTSELQCCDLERSAADFTKNPPVPPQVISITPDYRIVKCSNVNTGPSYSSCASCETDNIGWKSNNPGLGYTKARTDYSEYLTAVVNRYKNHPALLGWQMQLGYSGEDFYGPNHIASQFLGLSSKGNMQVKRRTTDYSQAFQESYKEWLKKKYGNSSSLRSAWQDTNVSLENFKIPLPTSLFMNGESKVFPDDGYLNYFVTLNDLTMKGKDFYEFRKQMKANDSKHYSALFKALDPKHVLFFNSYDNQDEYTDTNINGYFQNNVLRGDGTEDNYIQALAYGIIASKHGQYGLPAWENASRMSVNQKQADTMEQAGKAMKCFGYGFGYVTALEGTESKLPSWNSPEARRALQNIINYLPTQDCKCQIINRPLRFHGKTMRQILEMYNIADFNYCKSVAGPGPSPAPTTCFPNSTFSSSTGRCECNSGYKIRLNNGVASCVTGE